MGAICGVVGIDGRPFATSDLAGLLLALRPLGRDGAGAWAGAAGRMGVALGVCGQTEPLRSADGTLCLVADAALDCRPELQAALGIRATVPDAELILAAYERWGEGCLDHLSGEFAFALADASRGGVLIARDQIGVRPLHVHQRRGVVAFATTALSLCALEGVGHGLDRERVGEWLALVPDTERTFVERVAALPPGHCAWVDADGLRRRRYWTLDPDRIVELGSAEAYAGELRATFDAAVECRLPAGEPVGVMLSGGLDSTAVAATAARLRPDEAIRTYTSVPAPGWSGPTLGETEADESPLVRDLAAWHPNLRLAFVSGDQGPLLASFDERFAAGSPPPRNPENELWMAEVHRLAAADGVRTLLTGWRGNAFFSGDDPFWIAALLARGRLGAAGREAAALAIATGSARVAARELAWQLLPPAVRRTWNVAKARHAGVSADSELRFAGPGAEAAVRRHARAVDPASRRSYRADLLRLVTSTGSLAESAVVRDALSGVRRSDPTADLRVIALCATQPPWARRRHGRTRVVVRDAMADRLPPSIAERTRRGAQLPDWFELLSARRGELVEELAAAREHAGCRELLDLDAIDAALRDWPDRERAHAAWARTTHVYRFNLLRALLMCRYLRFFDEHAGASRAHRLTSP